MSSQPLYRIVYADGDTSQDWSWEKVTEVIRFFANRPWIANCRPVAVEAVSPAPRATEDHDCLRCTLARKEHR